MKSNSCNLILLKRNSLSNAHQIIINNSKDLIKKRQDCKSSPAEKKIIKFLKRNKVKFTKEAYHPTLINDKTDRLLFLDFYLPSYRVAIEYDGLQHFKSIRGMGNLKERKRLDKIKNNWCKKNDILMIHLNRKHYYKIDEYLFKVLNQLFSI